MGGKKPITGMAQFLLLCGCEEPAMNVSITAELEAFVEGAVRSGRYGSASEVVREGLRMLEEREAKYQRLKRDIQIGLESGVAGELNEASVEDVKARGRARLAAKLAAE
jgi:antitoxin ParD1/3/4